MARSFKQDHHHWNCHQLPMAMSWERLSSLKLYSQHGVFVIIKIYHLTRGSESRDMFSIRGRPANAPGSRVERRGEEETEITRNFSKPANTPLQKLKDFKKQQKSLCKIGWFSNRQTRLCKKLEDFKTSDHPTAKNWRILKPANTPLPKIGGS